MAFTPKPEPLAFSSLWEGSYFFNGGWIASIVGFLITFALEKRTNESFRTHWYLWLTLAVQCHRQTGLRALAALTRTEQHPWEDRQGQRQEPGQRPLRTASGSGSGACRCWRSRQLRRTSQLCSLRDGKRCCDSVRVWGLLSGHLLSLCSRLRLARLPSRHLVAFVHYKPRESTEKKVKRGRRGANSISPRTRVLDPWACSCFSTCFKIPRLSHHCRLQKTVTPNVTWEEPQDGFPGSDHGSADA